MPRPLRADFPGARHHVTNRGARRLPIFHRRGERAEFVGLVARLPEQFGVEVHGYALMENHYHLMLRTPRGNLSRALAWLGQVWTQRTNARQEWDGSLFKGRFHNVVVESDVHWGHLLAYLHLNPVKAGLVAKAEHATWTSHRAYVRLGPQPPWLTVAELIEWHGGRAGVAEYVRAVAEQRVPEPAGFAERVAEPPVSGCSGLELPDVSHWAPREIEALIDRVVPEDGAAQARRGVRSPEAIFRAWALCRVAGRSMADVGRRTGVSRQAVARRIEAMEEARHSEPVWSWLTELRSQLEHSVRSRKRIA